MLTASSAVTALAPIDGIRSQGKTQVEYRVHVSQASDATADPEWDAFVAKTPGGHHAQTSLWAQLKATVGWQSVRIVITQSEYNEYDEQDKQIVAGAQILLRSLPIAGTIGFVPKGPVFAGPDPALRLLLFTQLDQIAKTYRMMQLIVQPAREDETLETHIAQRGFRPSPLEVFPTASVVIDLQQDLDVILASMKSETRYNIRRGQRKGMRVREGNQHDIPAFYRMFQATSQRQDFSVKPEAYYVEKHRLLSPHGYCKLFLAECETEIGTEVVSAMLAIPFGDTVLFKRGGWSGRYGNLRPNEVMHWAALQWAKAHGYRYYDFEGIDPVAATAILRGERLPASLADSVSRFKLGLSRNVVFRPGAYDYVYNPVLRLLYTHLYPKLANRPAVKQIVDRIRAN